MFDFWLFQIAIFSILYTISEAYEFNLIIRKFQTGNYENFYSTIIAERQSLTLLQ